jgi:hypothetical protein
MLEMIFLFCPIFCLNLLISRMQVEKKSQGDRVKLGREAIFVESCLQKHLSIKLNEAICVLSYSRCLNRVACTKLECTSIATRAGALDTHSHWFINHQGGFHRSRWSNKILSKEIISIRSLVLLWHARVHAPTIFLSVARAMVQASSRVSTCRVRMPSSVVSSIIIPSWIPIRVEFIVQNRNNGTSEQGHEKHSPSWFLWLHFPKA